MRCNTCTTVIPHQAKFCPKCGARATAAGGPAPPPRAPGALPSTRPIPRFGKLFIGLGVLGVTLVGLGVAQRNTPLVFFGAGILAGGALAAGGGHHVS